MFAKLSAEFFGTFWLVLGGCGSAVLAAAFPGRRDRPAGCLTRLRPDGAHRRLRPGSHFRWSLQSRGHRWIVGGRQVRRRPGASLHRRAGVGRHRRRGRTVRHRERHSRLQSVRAASPPTVTANTRRAAIRCSRALVSEIVMTFMFLIVILGATHRRAPVGFAGLAIGLALTLIHLISIPVTNTSVNPARSTGPARVRRRLGAAAAVAVLGDAHRRRGARRVHLQDPVRGGCRQTADQRTPQIAKTTLQ